MSALNLPTGRRAARRAGDVAVAVPGLLIAAAAAGAGCSTRHRYDNVQGWQHQQGLRVADLIEREGCRRSSARSCEQYESEREALRRAAEPVAAPDAAASAAARR